MIVMETAPGTRSSQHKNVLKQYNITDAASLFPLEIVTIHRGIGVYLTQI